MARYIDADIAIEEIDKLQDSLMSNNDTIWKKNKPIYKGLCNARGIINDIPTADVVPKSEVAQILENNQMCLEIIEIQDQTIQIAKANIARLQTLPRKIFEEIERLLAVYSYTDEYGKEVIGVDVEELIAELKKKYTEEKV